MEGVYNVMCLTIWILWHSVTEFQRDLKENKGDTMEFGCNYSAQCSQVYIKMASATDCSLIFVNILNRENIIQWH